MKDRLEPEITEITPYRNQDANSNFVAQKPKRWKQWCVGIGVAILGFLTLQYLEHEMRKSVWARCNLRITRPMKELLIEIRDAEPERAKALAAHMVENWNRISIRPWMETVDDVRAEFEDPKKQRGKD